MNLTQIYHENSSAAGDWAVALIGGEETQYYSPLRRQATSTNTLVLLAHPAGLEPATL